MLPPDTRQGAISGLDEAMKRSCVAVPSMYPGALFGFLPGLRACRPSPAVRLGNPLLPFGRPRTGGTATVIWAAMPSQQEFAAAWRALPSACAADRLMTVKVPRKVYFGIEIAEQGLEGVGLAPSFGVLPSWAGLCSEAPAGMG